MKQKFRKLTFVHICKEMPSHMSCFESDFDAIVNGTYSQLYGGKDIDSYSLFVLRGDGKKIIDKISWYKECQLTALEKQDSKLAEELIEKYHMRRIKRKKKSTDNKCKRSLKRTAMHNQ